MIWILLLSFPLKSVCVFGSHLQHFNSVIILSMRFSVLTQCGRKSTHEQLKEPIYFYNNTVTNLNLPLTQTNFCSPSGHFLYNFILDNSNSWHDNLNLPLTQTNFCSPSGHFLYNFILDNSNSWHDNLNLPLTPTNFCFPSGHFLYNFTLNNLNSR